MAVYLISYDLKKPGQKYDDLHDAIKSDEYWSHYLESTWIIETSKKLTDIADHLVNQIDKNDRLLVIEAKDNYSGWMSAKFWDWMKQRF